MKRIKEIQPLLVAIYTYNHINGNNDNIALLAEYGLHDLCDANSNMVKLVASTTKRDMLLNDIETLLKQDTKFNDFIKQKGITPTNKSYVYMIEFDWSVEDGCDVETELFFDYEKALTRFDEIIKNEKTDDMSWVADVFKPNGTILKGYSVEEHGNRNKKENLYWSCVMDEYYMYHSIVQLKKIEIK